MKYTYTRTRTAPAHEEARRTIRQNAVDWHEGTEPLSEQATMAVADTVAECIVRHRCEISG